MSSYYPHKRSAPCAPPLSFPVSSLHPSMPPPSALSGVEQILTVVSAPLFAWVFREGLEAGEPGIPFFAAAVIVFFGAVVGSAAFNLGAGGGEVKSGLHREGVEMTALSQSDDLSDAHVDEHAGDETEAVGALRSTPGEGRVNGPQSGHQEADEAGRAGGGTEGPEEATTLVSRVRATSMQSRVAALSFA